MSTKSYRVTNGAAPRVSAEDSGAQMQAELLFNASLCTNCRHQSDCGFLPRASAPIFECELYECGPAGKPRLMVVKTADSQLSLQGDEPEALLGLCMNCENMADCNLPKPAGGVWMCEEYR
ncbi:MAG TPA: hypothetical protein VLH81_03550 [Desulfobacterales bacterium]|nr:hypothetical protein [Desulfobacterales bacterium]